MSKRDSAVKLAQKGFKIFLLGVDSKIPAIDVVTDKAICDPAKVREMWSDPFGNSRHENIGINTNDLLVLDFDTKSGQDAADVAFTAFREASKCKHVAKTRSGGFHVFYRLSPGVCCASTVKKISPVIDTRSFHSYVVGAGSDIDGAYYKWLISPPEGLVEPASVADLELAPQELIEACGQPTVREARDLSIEWDTAAALSQAEEYLLRHAPEAKQGEGGDDATYRVACKVRQFGVSQETALLMIDEHWNQTKALPPWSLNELGEKIENAYRYAKAAPHVPGSEFDPIEIDAPKPTPVVPADCPRFVEQPFFDAAAIPRRQWIVEDVLARGFLTLINAPPGAGKTQWLAQLLLAVTFDRSDMIDYLVREPANVWSFNAEDDSDELKRRIGGAVIGYGLARDDQITKYSISSGVRLDFKVATWDASKQRVVKNEAALKAFAKQIVDNNVGVVILDPLADLHEVPESNNDAIKMVARIFTELAIESTAAIVIATHSRKQPGASSEGHAGNPESVRGGFSQVAKARIMLTITGASIKDAKAAKIDLDDRGSFIRIDTAKNNLGTASRGAKPKWFKFEGVPLGNGDSVGVLRKADLAQSRLKKEPAENEPNSRAVAIADSMERAGLAPEVKQSWTDVRVHTAQATGESAERDGPLGRWPNVVGYDVAVDAGKGRIIEFKKPVSAGKPTRVILRRQATVDSPAEAVATPRCGLSVASPAQGV
ncbi:MAG TPA: AAA family ATPase [Aestuariivirga sp.]|nr:AAA family ATPase [Aestuariivirga sp.]